MTAYCPERTKLQCKNPTNAQWNKNVSEVLLVNEKVLLFSQTKIVHMPTKSFKAVLTKKRFVSQAAGWHAPMSDIQKLLLIVINLVLM